MKFPSAVHWLWMANAALAASNVGTKKKEEERQLKEKAMDAVQRFLWLFSSEPDEKYDKTSTRVLWDGKMLLPMNPQDSKASNEELKDPMDFSKEDSSAAEGESRLATERVRRKQRTRKGRRRHRHRRIKAGDKSSKSSKDDDDLKVIRKSVKGASSGNEILCFEGSYQDVTDACALYNADCCVGSQACVWEADGPSIICQGACREDSACYKIPSGSYIFEDSCIGQGSCAYMATASTENKPLKIKARSCIGNGACNSMCQLSPTCTITIGQDSCRVAEIVTQPDVCASMGASSPVIKAVEIGDGACQGEIACASMGEKSTVLDHVYLDDAACTLDASCAAIGYGGDNACIEVGAHSCAGVNSCTTAGFYSERINIHKNSCQSTYSCARVGYLSRGRVSIDQDSCTSYFSCYGVAFAQQGAVLIAKEACTDNLSCFGVGRRVFDYDGVEIGKSACSTGPDECSALVDESCYYTSKVPKNAVSCSSG